MKENTYVVLMAGGIGSRFWPSSRKNHPKQFVDVLNCGKSLIQLTYDRFLPICNPENVFVVTNIDYVDLVKEQLPNLKDEQILGEPTGRNTAPCIAYALYKIRTKNPDALMVVSPSDHLIINQIEFIDAIKASLENVKKGDRLLTLGIKPNRPETGYGYIQYLQDSEPIKPVKTFTEKPNHELAVTFLESGDFVWNSGIFVWHTQAIMQAFEQFLPDMAEMFAEGKKHYGESSEKEFVEHAYQFCKNISIDYGIMEKAGNVHVILGDFGWSDLGSWGALHEVREKDEHNNITEGDVIVMDTSNCLIKNVNDKLIVVDGLKGYLIADCDNVLVVAPLGNDAKIKEYAAEAKRRWNNKYL